MPRRLFLAAALTGGLLLTCALAACGDGAGEQPRTTALESAAAPTVESILALDRFHYVASLTMKEKRPGRGGNEVTISTEGDFQQPDRHSFTYTIRRGDGVVSRSAVVIGLQAWTRAGDQPWQSAALTDPQLGELAGSAFSSIRPQFLAGPEYEQVLQSIRRLPSTPEELNGARADHYQVGLEGEQFFRALLVDPQFLPVDPRWDLWLSHDGQWPVRLLVTASVNSEVAVLTELGLAAPTAWELRIDISRPNDPTLSVIAPPTGG